MGGSETLFGHVVYYKDGGEWIIPFKPSFILQNIIFN